MGVPIPPLAAPPSPAASIADAFPVELLGKLAVKAHSAREDGETGGETRRKSLVKFMDVDSELYPRVAEIAARMNAMHWRFNLTALVESIQLACYPASIQGEYDWHQDFGSPTSSRKLSMTVQLSKPDAYEGGDLQIFKSGGAIITAPREFGTTIVFPAYQLHRVTPVTKGVRCSMVAWISGPPFQ